MLLPRFLLVVLSYLAFAAFTPAPTTVEAPLSVVQPRLEYKTNPTGIDVPAPRFSWRLEGEGRDRVQSAYRIEVDNGWDSGKVASNATNQIAYAGPALRSATPYRWRVRVWDGADQPSAWTDWQTFSTGLLHFSDWRGKFISHAVGYDTTDKYGELYLPPARYLRKSFTASKPIQRAVAYTTALGLYELRLNGEKVGEQSFLPGWTDYNKRLYYQTFDVTDRLQQGENVIGATIADGWYAGYIGYALLVRLDRVREFYGVNPSFMGQLHIEYTDGTTEIIASDNSWRGSTGPTLEADILMGETYDARLARTGWDRAGYDASDWAAAKLYTYPEGRLQAYPGTYVEDLERLTPVVVTEPKPGVYVFDLGKNVAGVAELTIQAAAGTQVQLKFGELLREDGTVMTENLRRARATDTYIASGQGTEVWRPKFTYHGFQYVEVTGLDAAPTAEAITGIAMSSIDMEASTFDAANPMNEQLYRNILTTQASNFFEVPTDCPQRDERLGWTGDAQIYARSATYNADVAAFFTKYIIDLDDAQRWYGAYPNFAPFPYSRPDQYAPAWMDAGVILPYTAYRVYNDTRIVDYAWAGMTRFMEFQADAAGDDYLRPGGGNNWGDWLNVGEKTSDGFIGAAYYGYDAALMTEMATALGKLEEAGHYAALFDSIKVAFAREYIQPDGRTTEDLQTTYALALYFDLYPEKLAAAGAARLAELIEANGDKFTTGFLGTKHVMLVLSDYGYDDLAYRLFQQTDYPSWGYSVANGSTSIWERWNSYTKDDESNAEVNAAMNSFSHYAFGSVAEWMFQHGLGIDTDGPGYRNIIIRPAVSREMDRMAGSYESINGTIRSAWAYRDGGLHVDVTIPVNTTAAIYLPGTEDAQILDGEEVIDTDYADGRHLVRVGSGSYQFTVGSIQ
ncbi:Alpha-L-rhamnosidase [Neolewinella maritima]|uniref:alpha-L-rhamnosidase n=1 Tax=Neolewinella maritima TaxID=1383882 RepID=A0ABN8F9B3_9BACT|nr:alpha-L-rhamnosidase [Neolewinella maritima]CAH1001854.1 Alpha-L-rhamnosidase [Neolewinella maritima]